MPRKDKIRKTREWTPEEKAAFRKRMVDGKAAKQSPDIPSAAMPLEPPAVAPAAPIEIQEAKQATRFFKVSWWRVLLGGALLLIGLVLLAMYVMSRSMALGPVGVLIAAAGGVFVYQGLSKAQAGYHYGNAKRVYNGKENAIIISARRDAATGLDIPVEVYFDYLEKLPVGAELHKLRNNGRHYYELKNLTTTDSGKELVPVHLPDKRPFPPEVFKIPAVMQNFKDYWDYSPATMFQKVAPLIIIGAMGVVGILMVITVPPAD